MKDDVVLRNTVDMALVDALNNLREGDVIKEHITYVGSIHDVTSVLGYIRQRGFMYGGGSGGTHYTHQGNHIKLVIRYIKMRLDAVKPTPNTATIEALESDPLPKVYEGDDIIGNILDEDTPTEQSDKSTDITYEEIIDISRKRIIEKTNELYEQVLENIIESANMGMCTVRHNIMWDTYHLADGVVSKLKEYGFTNARYKNAIGDCFIIVEWELGE